MKTQHTQRHAQNHFTEQVKLAQIGFSFVLKTMKNVQDKLLNEIQLNEMFELYS